MEEADLVIFSGGEDVDTGLYHAERHPMTSCNPFRDKREKLEFQEAHKLGKPMLGVCRGSQFLCVMAGGVLVQHQENPTFIHPITTTMGMDILVTSTHHQAQFPWILQPEEYKVMGWSMGVSKFHQEGGGHEMVIDAAPILNREVEVCYYPLIRALAIQSHPEMAYDQRHTNQAVMQYICYCQLMLDLLMKGEL
jgi:putative glutamine amidotransferase